MKRTKFFVFTATFLLLLTSCKNEVSKQENEGVAKEDTIVKEELAPVNKGLIAEWALESIDNAKSPVELNFTFSDNGEFNQVSSDGSVKGTYKLSSDAKQIELKSEKSNDIWKIVELNDSVLVVSAIGANKAENLYKFKK
jgi:hypothetical protein